MEDGEHSRQSKGAKKNNNNNNNNKDSTETTKTIKDSDVNRNLLIRIVPKVEKQ